MRMFTLHLLTAVLVHSQSDFGFALKPQFAGKWFGNATEWNWKFWTVWWFSSVIQKPNRLWFSAHP